MIILSVSYRITKKINNRNHITNEFDTHWVSVLALYNIMVAFLMNQWVINRDVTTVYLYLPVATASERENLSASKRFLLDLPPFSIFVLY